jgi:putative ABC transport system permease protein
LNRGDDGLVVGIGVSKQLHLTAGEQKDVLLTVLKKGLTLVLVGTIAGLAASSAMMRLIASQIWGVSTAAPWTFSIVATMVVVAGLTASLFPARRAAQMDPTVSLRCE